MITSMNDKEQLRKKLQEDLYGAIPVFFSEIQVNEKESDDPIFREIAMEKYQTNAFKIRPYHKVISKMI